MIKTILADEFRFLTFRRISPAIHTHWRAYLAFGLFFTWLAGVGRYWDNPRAELWQHLGLGSVAYVFVLALIIWLLLAPMRPKNWSYRNVLIFITLTAPPAVLYAIPVERIVSPDAARAANAWFLAIVAAWRVGLYTVFLRRVGALSAFAVVVATLLPLVIIVVGLAVLNLEHVVFDLMGGMREDSRSPNDVAYMVVVALSVFSVYASPFLVLGYMVAVFNAWQDSEVAGTTKTAPTDQHNPEPNRESTE
jgi:hypothetical protein